MSTNHAPSQLLLGEAALIREHAFTRWMSPDLLPAATDFLKNLGLIALYVECSENHFHRYLCWQAPKGWGCEVRSGRTLEQFNRFDAGNVERGWPLLTLHINGNGIYSAVWLAPNHQEVARKVLAGYGITPAGDTKEAT